MNPILVLKSLGAACLCGALQLFHTAAAAATEVPSPFYAWQADVPSEPGRLLREEPLEAELLLENAGSAVRILYTSGGHAGDTVVVSGAVFVPKGAAPDSGWPVLAWSHGTVGIADICAPSFRGRSERDTTYLNHWLAAGYAIVATDYEGLGTRGTHPYLHCRSEANSNIDAVNAAHELQIPLAKQWMVMGQSQGGQGALCTGAYVGERKSELEFLGTLATAPGVNFMQRFRAGNAEDPNPFIGIALLLGRGFETYEPSFKREVAFTEQSLSMMPLTDTVCVEELIGMGVKAGLTSGETLKVIPFSDTPGVAEASLHMEIPETGWQHPVYIAQGTADELVRDQDVYDFALQLCEEQVDVTLEVFEGADHSGPMNTGIDQFQAWVAARFAKSPASNNCSKIEELVDTKCTRSASPNTPTSSGKS